MKFFILFPFLVVLAHALTPEQAKAFYDYYYNGSGSDIVVAEFALCDSVVDHECSGDVKSVEKGTTYMAWMSFVVPKDDKNQTVVIQYRHNGEIVKTNEVTVSGSIRYRTWKGFTPNKAGEWEIVISHDKQGKPSEIFKANVSVKE